jgi:hypothetical protein
MTQEVKLTYEEYLKALAAGMTVGGACCCMGAKDDNEYCPCDMYILNMLTPDGQEKCKTHLKKQNRVYTKITESEWAEIDAKYAEAHLDEVFKSPARKKRMELIAKKAAQNGQT